MKKILIYGIILIIIIIIGINLYVKLSTKNKIITNYKKLSNIDCIIILGAGIRNNKPSPMLEDRLLEGIKLYQKNISNKILMSGDHGRKEYDEVNIMKKYAIEKGIPSENIFMDHAGFSTYESIYRAKKIFQAKRVVIVTQKYHLYRALYIADKLGLTAYGVSSDPRKYMGATNREIREILARDKDFIKCIFKPKPTYLGETIKIEGNGDTTNDKNIEKGENMKTDNIKINTQSSIKLILDKIIYFDPYKIETKSNDADIIFITHNHYDHMDIDSINKIKNNNTIIIAPKTIEEDIRKIELKEYIFLNPNEKININNLNIKTIPAYNIEKSFHPKKNNWLGYLITSNNISYYISGDTDKTEDAEKVKCDIALIPIGGYYTMDVNEATELIKTINPKIVIPTHYGSIVGNTSDGKKLKENLNNTTIEVIEKLNFNS